MQSVEFAYLPQSSLEDYCVASKVSCIMYGQINCCTAGRILANPSELSRPYRSAQLARRLASQEREREREKFHYVHWADTGYEDEFMFMSDASILRHMARSDNVEG